jgi:hypothetical protein
MQFKPHSERTNLPLVAGFIVWALAVLRMPYSHQAYMVLTGVAIGLLLSQVLFNVSLRRV